MGEPVIAFIGCGNMGRSLIGGLLDHGWPADRLRAADPDAAQRERARETFGIQVTENNAEALSGADVVVLAVKPQVLKATVGAAAGELGRQKPLLVSIAAGIRLAQIQQWIGTELPLVRAMPNTPALLRAGVTGLFANEKVSAAQRELAERIMGAVGVTLWLDSEPLLDVVTALSGSGPAYFFLFMEALEEAATALGLPAEQARVLTLETALGAARMAREGAHPPAELRHQVTSPGGTTDRAIQVLQGGGLEQLLADALRAAAERSAELSRTLGEE